MKIVRNFAIIVSLIISSHGARISEVHIKIEPKSFSTGSSLDLNNGFITIEMVNSAIKFCSVNDPHPADGSKYYNYNLIYVFTGSTLDNCQGFDLPDNRIPTMMLHYEDHPGFSDHVAIEWIRILLDDRTYLVCPFGKLIGGGSHEVFCS